MRSEFEKAYEPNPHKSPFTEVRFNEEKQIYEPLNPTIDHVARSLNAAWYGYRIRQTEVDALTLQVAEMKSRLNDAYTDEEIAVGHRIDNDIADCEILDYPEDYTSLNCKKYDERVK